MTVRSLFKSVIVSAIVFGAVPMDASACFWGHGCGSGCGGGGWGWGHHWGRNRCCRPVCCPAPPTCCDTGYSQPMYSQPAYSSGGCCASTGEVMYAPQVATYGGRYSYRSGYQAGAVAAYPATTTYRSGYTAQPAYYGGMMSQIQANRRFFGKP